MKISEAELRAIERKGRWLIAIGIVVGAVTGQVVYRLILQLFFPEI